MTLVFASAHTIKLVLSNLSCDYFSSWLLKNIMRSLQTARCVAFLWRTTGGAKRTLQRVHWPNKIDSFRAQIHHYEVLHEKLIYKFWKTEKIVCLFGSAS